MLFYIESVNLQDACTYFSNFSDHWLKNVNGKCDIFKCWVSGCHQVPVPDKENSKRKSLWNVSCDKKQSFSTLEEIVYQLPSVEIQHAAQPERSSTVENPGIIDHVLDQKHCWKTSKGTENSLDL